MNVSTSIAPKRLWLECQIQNVGRTLVGERGAATTEYGLLVISVAVVMIGILGLFGDALLDLFTGAEDEFNTLPPTPERD